ncbi:putative leucine-rich repeat domain superfamily [Helianthus anomalus]
MLTIGQPARLISCLPRGLEMKFDEFKRCLKWIHAEGGMDDVSKTLASVEALFLFRHWTLEKLSTFNLLKLKYCLLAECNEMETLVDASGPSEYVETRTRDGEKAGLELLQYLSIHHMNKLQSIWKGAIAQDLLKNLVCLTELIVEDCPKVISLISSEYHNVKHGPIFPSLERIFLLDLSELVNIFGGLYVLEELNTLLIYNCLNLRLSIMELPHINKIEGENEWWNDLDCDKSPWENIFVPLKKRRYLIEQLYEATDSLNRFHNIRFEGKTFLRKETSISYFAFS